MIKKHSIPEVYNGIQMRSHLETLYAKIFDKYGIDYIYEGDSYNLDGVWYKPDFYLPQSNQFFEVKGVMDDIDFEKIKKLCILSNLDVLVGHQDGRISAYFNDKSQCFLDDELGETYYFGPDEKMIFLAKCRKCGNYSFRLWQFGGEDCIICGDDKTDFCSCPVIFDLNKFEIRDCW